jgi:peptidoglycan/LPS O-acetylase OafA/YrhL
MPSEHQTNPVLPDALPRMGADPGLREPAVLGRISALDGLRGVAIALVLLHHFASGGHHFCLINLFFRIAQAGWVGVDLFFVLSGFLITSILLGTKTSPTYFRDFYARRALRIFPLFYGALLLAYFIGPLFFPPVLDAGRNQAWLWFYGANVFPVFYRETIATPNVLHWSLAHFWSLAVEEQFYLMWPFLVLKTGRRSLLNWCIAILVIAPALRVGLTLVGWGDEDILYQFTFCRMDSLATGALIAVVRQRVEGINALRPWAIRGAIVFGLALAVISLLRHGLAEYDPVMNTVGFSMLALFFGSVLILAILARPLTLWHRVITSRPLRFLGKYSYGIYVLHTLTIYPVVAISKPVAGLSYSASMLVRLILGSASSVGLALLSWNLLEKHFLKLKEKFDYVRGIKAELVIAAQSQQQTRTS